MNERQAMIENLADSIGERHYNLLVDALQALAGMCDGASARDGYGFNKLDTNLGKQLAYASAARTLSQSEQARAIRVVYKYKGQLSFDLPAPADYVLFGDAPGPGPAIGGNGTEGGDGRMMVKVAGQVLCIYMPTAALRAQYLQKVKDIPGRKWEPEQPGKPWSIPMSSAWYLKEWLPENAALGDDVANIFASAKRPATIPTAPKVHQVPTVELVKDGFAVYFKFAQNDPTFAKLLTAVRALPERKWEGEKGYWLVPTRLSQELTNAIPTAVWSQEAQALRDEMIARKRLSKVVASDFEVPGMKGTMFPYQRAGIEFIEKTNGRCVVGDDMGLGKTLQALGYLQLHPEKRPAVIVVPATLKPNWMIEIKKWMTTKEQVVILSGRKTYDLRLTGGTIFIVNYDILSYWVEPLRAMNPQVVIADEAHVLKNGAKTARGAAFYGSPKKKQPGLIAGVPHLLPLTGTAIENRPVEFFPLLHAIDPVAWPNFMQFARRYCNASNGSFGWQFGGASNLPELHDKIQPYYLRRTKVQVLTELPPKRRISLPVELTPKAMGEYKKVLDEFGVHAEEVRKQGGKLGADALAIIERAKQAAMRGKMDAAIEWIESYIEQSSTGKLVIFCTHTFVVDELMGHFKGRAVKVTGSVTGKARQQAVEDFQNTDVPLFVGNLKAAGVGITLTRASATLTLELGWTPGGHTQAEDRVHRIGQEADSVEAYYMLALGTIEERIFDLLEEKRQTVDMVLDGEAEDRETFGMLSILANEIIRGGK